MENYEALRTKLQGLTLEEKQDLYREQSRWVEECEGEVLNARYSYAQIRSEDSALALRCAELQLDNEREELEIIRQSLQ